jgi:hypothetical protein
MVYMLLLLHAAATWYMVGLIWMVQVVHYPLMAGVGNAGYADYQTRHMRQTTWVVLPPMLIELASSCALLVVAMRTEASLPAWLAAGGLGLVLLLWAVTFGVSVPLHGRLHGGFDAAAHRRLVVTNWWRTLLWSLRGGVALAMLYVVRGEAA